jgi:hypothetical protein
MKNAMKVQAVLQHIKSHYIQFFMINTRKYQRLSKEYHVEYGPVSDMFEGARLKSSRVKNVSGGGVLFGTDEALEVGSKVFLSILVTGWRNEDGSFIPVPDTTSELRLEAIAEIVRVEHDVERGYYRTGAKFVGRVH